MPEKTKWPDPFEGRLTAEEIEDIERWRVGREHRTRRRRAPSWNAETDPPWRSLEDGYIAALKGCTTLSTSDLETIIARGTVWLTGTRDDVIGDFLPNRIEQLIAAAERRYFAFEANSITATYSKPPDRLSHRSLITFKNVRAHWPMLVEALQTAGFEISATSKQVRPRGGSPPQKSGRQPISHPTPKQLDDYFKRTFKKGDKRDPAIRVCCDKNGATWREALAAYQRIPDKLRRKRGGQPRSS